MADSKRANQLKSFLRGGRLAIDPSHSLRRRSMILYYETDPIEAMRGDWYAVGRDLEAATEKFREDMIGDGVAVSLKGDRSGW